MGLINKLKELADACRAQTQTKAQLTIDEMIELISGLYPINTIEGSTEYPSTVTWCGTNLQTAGYPKKWNTVKTLILPRITSLGEQSFQQYQPISNLPNVTTIIAPQLETIRTYAFQDSRIHSIKADKLRQIFPYAFKNSSIYDISFDNVEYIGKEAFKGVSVMNLKATNNGEKLVFNKLTEIEDNVFDTIINCFEFKQPAKLDISSVNTSVLILRGEKMSTLTNIQKTNLSKTLLYLVGQIYVPATLLHDYQYSGTNWDSFRHAFRSLDELPEEYK